MSVRYRCNQCLSPGCSSFFPQSTDPSKCYCSHSSMSHDPGPPAAEPIHCPSFPPRGGLGSCSEFRSVGNIQIEDYFQLCTCSQCYSEHAQTGSAPPQSSTPVQPPPSLLSVHNQPYRVPSTTLPSTNDNFFSNPPAHSIPLYQSPVISGPSLVTGYTPAHQASQLQVTCGHTAFGVPMSGVSMTTNGSRGCTRGRGCGIVINTQHTL
ncbi:hypothetical protein BD769DRAFT_1668025 [Suillus cothurnatus]|nr:hypothetical protein BD769DRAFT_1668025 [Suillus cothurnatus]